MSILFKSAASVILLLGMGCSGSPEVRLRKMLASQVTGVIHMPSGVIEISSELKLAPGAHDLTIVGSQTTLKASTQFVGRAILSGERVKHIRLADFSVDGNRDVLAKPLAMAPPENQFRVYYPNNGLLFDEAESVEISGLHFTNIVNFPILVSRSSAVRVTRVAVEDSGSLNALGRNNTTGGMIFEEGSSNLEVRGCTFLRIRGNALWTHSMYQSPRLHDGVFAGNHFDTVGRDAIEIGHATAFRVEDNTGMNIGFPREIVDVENGGTPVSMDTAGNVDRTVYQRNFFEEIDGKCIDLDGFHDGSVRGNRCVNRKSADDYPFGHFGIVMNNANPDMRSENVEIVDNRIDGARFGGLFLIGNGHHVEGNVFENLNGAGCNENTRIACIYLKDEPEMLESGIYLGRGAERPAVTRDNVIRGNRISGHGMKNHCVAFAPTVTRQSNTIAGNQCSDN